MSARGRRAIAGIGGHIQVHVAGIRRRRSPAERECVVGRALQGMFDELHRRTGRATTRGAGNVAVALDLRVAVQGREGTSLSMGIVGR